MKKLIALLLVLVMSLGIFAACDDTGGPGSDTGPSVDGDSAATSMIKEKGPDKIANGDVTLSVWVRNQETCITDYENALMTRWYEEKTGVKVNWTTVPESGAADKFTTSIASGEGNRPDIYNYYMTPADITMYGGENGVFVPLDDLIEKGWMPNFAKYLENNPVLKTMRSEDGKMYAVPVYASAPQMIYCKKVWVNKNWLEQYKADGGKLPETTTEFEAMLRYFKDNDMNGNGDTTDELPMMGCQKDGWGTDPFVWLISPFALAIGDGYEQFLTADENGKVTWVAGTDGYRDGLRWANKLLNEGLLVEETYTQALDMYQQAVTDGLVGVAAGATEQSFCVIDSDIENWVALAPMEGPTGLRQVPVYSTDYSSLSYSVAITKDCKNLEAAAKWLDYFFSEEGSKVASFGFEGINYELNTEVASTDGTLPSIVRYPDNENRLNTRWGNRIAPDIDMSMKECPTEGETKRYVEAAKIYEPYLKETGIPLSAFPLSADEEAQKSAAFDWVVLQTTYYKGFRFIRGSKDRDLVDGINLDINNDEHWQAYLDYANTDGMLDTYIRLTEKKFFGE